MYAYIIQHYAAGRGLGRALAVWLILLSVTAGAVEEKFEVLQIGTQTYSNVTVTTKAKSYIFLLHSAGMTSVKVSQLSPDLQEKLGYATAAAPKGPTNTAAVWAKREIAKINGPQARELGKQLEQKWRAQVSAKLTAMHLVGPTLIVVAAGVGLLIHLFQCYCCLLICRKTGNPPGILIWLPGLQILPLLRAAGMSGWWCLAYLVPLLNFVPLILWPLKIAKARGKSVWVGVLLILPVTNVFAFLYLAFSNGGAVEKEEEPEPKIMTLQAV